MADYTPEQVEKKIMDIIENALWSKAMRNAIIRLHHEAIQSEVYDKYDPTQDERRYSNGGLLDVSNLDFCVDVSNSNVRELIMYNITQGTSGINDETLTQILQSGTGYDWTRSNIYQAEQSGNPIERPFIVKTRELIEQNRKLFIDILKQELITVGLKIA